MHKTEVLFWLYIFVVFALMGDGKTTPAPTSGASIISSNSQQNHSGSELSSSSTNGDKITPSDSNANHEPNDKFIFSSTSMEFAVSRKIAKYRQKNVSSDDINGHKQHGNGSSGSADGKNNLTGSSSGGSGADEDINFNKSPVNTTYSNNLKDMNNGAQRLHQQQQQQQISL